MMTMTIEKVIALVDRSEDSWVRLEVVRRVPRGLDLSFSVHKGQYGKRVDSLRITSLEVHEAKITALDGGGLALYSSTHPSARELVARQAQVRWSGASDDVAMIGALYEAHIEAVDDWIPFERFSSIRAISNDKSACRGPDFLMRAYAKALKSIGKQPRIILGRQKRKVSRPRVLHFGDSYIVADTFVAERDGEKKGDQPVTELKTGRKRKSRTRGSGPEGAD